jgi:CheY-like chemotaxis protein
LRGVQRRGAGIGLSMKQRSGAKDILLVDDDTDVRDTLGSLLEEHGFEVHAAENGDVALAHLSSNKPGLILLDLMMPVRNGWEVLDRLRSSDDMADIPVVVISAQEDAAPPGAMRRLQKPFRVEQLLDVVSSAIDASRVGST